MGVPLIGKDGVPPVEKDGVPPVGKDGGNPPPPPLAGWGYSRFADASVSTINYCAERSNPYYSPWNLVLQDMRKRLL